MAETEEEPMMTPEAPFLTVILPLRCTRARRYFFDRALEYLEQWPHPPGVELLIVDSGSERTLRKELEQAAESACVRYDYLNTAHELFAIGQARDRGVELARGEFVHFQDVDLRAPAQLYELIRREVDLNRMRENPAEFFTVPCIYLTPEGTEAFCAADGDERFWQTQRRMLEGDRSEVQAFAPVTSSMVVHRRHYLSLGGHRSEFYGHGFEDFELLHRMGTFANKFVRPDKYYHDTKSYDSQEYEGFRSFYTLFGYPAFSRGLFTVHLWHPREQTSAYDQRRDHNRELLQQFMVEFDEEGTQPPPLCDLSGGVRTLALGIEGDRSFLSIRQALPYLGEMLYRSEFSFQDTEALSAFIERKGIDRLFMFNPYGNQRRLSFYRWARETGFPYIVYERGGLPDSWFFDAKGFNADSRSYHPDAWNHPISDDEQFAIEAYMAGVLQGERTLEQNDARVGASRLRKVLKVGDRKVLFVPLQRPNDTVTRYFAGDVGGVPGFCDLVSNVAAELDPQEWVVLVKNHPLETVRPSIENVRFVDDGTHFQDLVSLADAVLLMNSGVGLYALMMNKPLMHVSESYYGFPGLARHVGSTEQALSFLEELPRPDWVTVTRYFHHLRNRVYSFGEPVTEQREEEDGSLMTITTGVRFDELRGLGPEQRFFYRDAPVDWTSPIYDRYRDSIRRWRRRLDREERERRNLSENGEKDRPKSSVVRKFKKLRHDPVAFVRDSKLVRRFS